MPEGKQLCCADLPSCGAHAGACGSLDQRLLEAPREPLATPLPSQGSIPYSKLEQIKTPHEGRFYLEQMKGIEPSTAAWEAAVLPLNYICRTYRDILPQSAVISNSFSLETSAFCFRGTLLTDLPVNYHFVIVFVDNSAL